MADFNVVDVSGETGSKIADGSLKSVSGLIIHHTGSNNGSYDSVVNGLSGRGLGITYVMERDGTVYRVVPEGSRTDHVKNSNARIKNVNSNYEGIEVIAADDGNISEAQREAFRSFADWHSKNYDYDPQVGLLGHGEVSPHKRQTEGATLKYTYYEAAGLPIPEDAMVGDIDGGFPAMTYAEYAGMSPLDNPFVAAVDAVAQQRVAPIPFTQSAGLAATRANTRGVDEPPIPRPRPTLSSDVAPKPVTMSERMAALRTTPNTITTLAKDVVKPLVPVGPQGRGGIRRPATEPEVPLPRSRPANAPRDATQSSIYKITSGVSGALAGSNAFYDSVVNMQRAISGIGSSSSSSSSSSGKSIVPANTSTASRQIESYTRQTFDTPSGTKPAPKPTVGAARGFTAKELKDTTPITTTRTVTRTIEVDNPDYQVYLGQLANNQRMTPTGAVITADQMRAISGSGAPIPQNRPAAAPLVAPPKKIKKVITEVVTVPAKKKKTTVTQQSSSSSNPAPAPATFRGTATGNSYVVGQTYKSADGQRTLLANADGTFTNVSTGKTSKGSYGSRSGSVSSNPPINQVSGSSTSSSGVGGTTRSMESSSRWTTGY